MPAVRHAPSIPSISDEALVERLLQGDQQAANALFKRHAAYLAGVVYRILGQDADLDDVVQEAFVEGFRRLGTMEDRSKVRAFLVTIAVRRIHRRLGWRYRWRDTASKLFDVAPRVSDPGHREGVHALYGVLGRVPPKERIAWVLHRVEGFTLPEAAEQSGVSLATVKRWIARVDTEVEAADVLT
jgi:RNA polymerase sigma-70 factor (ECF subfamily)